MNEQKYKHIYSVVKRIPEGQVATYGQVAALARISGARQVGVALSALPEDSDVPWHRVLNSKGQISQRSDPYFEDLQRFLLEQEGIVFDEKGRISLKKHQWKPRRK